MTRATKRLTNSELRQIIDSHGKGHAMVVPIDYGYLAAKELLVVREAQPVFFIEIEGGDWINAGRVPGSTFDFNNLPDGINHLYTVPPAPAVLTFDEWIRKQTAPIDTDCGMVGVEVMLHWMQEAYNATAPAREKAHTWLKETSWEEAEAITDSLETEIRNLIDDPTADNATCLVRSVIDACRAAMLNHSGDSNEKVEPVSQGYTLNFPVIPDGWKLVPIKLTEKMVIHGFESEAFEALADAVLDKKGWPYGCRESAECVTGIFKAMLAAAPAIIQESDNNQQEKKSDE